MIKKNDSHATDEDVLKKDKSVISDLTLEDLTQGKAQMIILIQVKKKRLTIDQNAKAEFINPMLAHTAEGSI